MSVTEKSNRSIARGTELSENKMRNIKGWMSEMLDDGELRRCDVVNKTFQKAVNEYPNVNPADIWNYGIYRNYLKLVGSTQASAQQSWRNVSGSAFEHFVVDYYNERLPRYLRVQHITSTEVRDTIDQMSSQDAGDLVDAVVLGRYDGEWHPFAGINTITSLKSRLGNYEESSKELKEAGLQSIVVTLDSYVPSGSVASIGEMSKETDSETLDLIQASSFDVVYSFNSKTVENQTVRQVGQTRFNDSFVDDNVANWEEYIEPMMRMQSYRVVDN